MTHVTPLIVGVRSRKQTRRLLDLLERHAAANQIRPRLQQVCIFIFYCCFNLPPWKVLCFVLGCSDFLAKVGGMFQFPSHQYRKTIAWKNIHFPFMTAKKFPPGFILHLNDVIPVTAGRILDWVGYGKPKAAKPWYTIKFYVAFT